MIKKRTTGLLVTLLFLAFGVRLLYSSVLSRRMDELVISDMATYDLLAVNLIEKGYYGVDAPWSYRPPLYPFFLSLVYRVFGHSHFVARVVQAGLAALTTLLVFYLARGLIGSAGALLAAFLTAADFSLIHLSGLLLSENLYNPLSLLLLLLLIRGFRKPGAGIFAAAGVAGGLAVLCRPTALPFLFLTGLVPFFPAAGFSLPGKRTLPRSRGESPSAGSLPGKGAATPDGKDRGPDTAAGWGPRPGKGLAGWAVMLLAAALTIAPWTIRNWRLHRAFVPVSTNAGTMLWMGLHPGAPGDYHYPEEDNPLYHIEDEVKRNRVGVRESIRFIRENPGETVRLAAVKMRIFWRGWLFTWSGRQWAVYGLLGLGGLLLSLKAWRRWLVPYLYLGSFTAVHLFVHSAERYRLPLHPLIAIWAALALGEIRKVIGGRTRRFSSESRIASGKTGKTT